MDILPKVVGELRLYSVEELSDLLDVNQRSIRQWLRDGRIQGQKLGVKWYVSEDMLKKYFNENAPERE